MITQIIMSAITGRPVGTVIIDKKYPTLYDQREGVKKWLETYLFAQDIVFKEGFWGADVSELTCILGGAAPYLAKFTTVLCESTTVIAD